MGISGKGSRPMSKWLSGALDYIPRWIEYQMRQSEQPGCAVAVVHKGKTVLEEAFGLADLAAGKALTPRHRFRVASHSKTFTAAGIMKLREDGRVGLDDAVGRHVDGLHPAVAAATIEQCLSHGSGIIRDGTDAGQWNNRRAFATASELRAALSAPPVIETGSRFKYSNHAYGLAGLVIEAVTGEPYVKWIRRAILEPAGLDDTAPDMPFTKGPIALGHSRKLPLGRRVAIAGDNPTHALAPATGFVSTARDLARFFARLDPGAKDSVLSPASRREMTRRRWRIESEIERHYGLGVAHGRVGEWAWFGHGGAFQGFLSRTVMVPEHGVAVSVLTNAIDGPADAWSDGILHILRQAARHGAPAAKLEDWTGRWWSLWRPLDLVPMGDRVLVAQPELGNPFQDATAISVSGDDRGRIAESGGYASYGETARLVRGRKGRVTEVWLAGTKLVPEAAIAAELEPLPTKARRKLLA